MDGDDDASLVRAAQAGRLEAFGDLIERHAGGLRGFLALLAVPASERDERSQDVFVEAFRSLRRTDPERPFGPWLRGIARHQVLAAGRLRGRARRARALDGIAELLAASDAEPEPFGDLLAPLRACVAALPVAARRLLSLRYGEDLDSGAIALRSGRSPEAVRMALGRLRAGLRECVRRRLAGGAA